MPREAEKAFSKYEAAQKGHANRERLKAAAASTSSRSA